MLFAWPALSCRAWGGKLSPHPASRPLATLNGLRDRKPMGPLGARVGKIIAEMARVALVHLSRPLLAPLH